MSLTEILLSINRNMEQNLQREPGMREGSFYYHTGNGYHFNVIRQQGSTIYFKCVLAVRGCRARASYNTTRGFTSSGEHDHGPDHHYVGVIALKRNILARCAVPNLPEASIQTVVLEESLRCVACVTQLLLLTR